MTVTARPPAISLVDIFLPLSHRLFWNCVLVIGFSVLVASCARIAFPLPFTPVPITGQTLGVLLTGALLGRQRGALALLVYLFEGMVGLPVFAGGRTAWTVSSAGMPVIIGPTAGYLFSYPIAAFLIGLLAERGWDRTFRRAVVAMAAGEVVIYAIGLPWLAMYVGPNGAIPAGLLPFIPGDLAKLLLAATVLPSAWRLLGMTWRGAGRSLV